MLGPVITLLKFESNLDVTMKIAISSNNTKCVNLDVQDTHIKVNEMKIQLIETYVTASILLLNQSKSVSKGPAAGPEESWSTIVL